MSGLPEDLADLNDVVISGLTNGQILRYNSTTGVWENTDQGNLDLNDLNDVTIVSPSNGQVLVYNSSTSQWENSSGGYVPYVGAVTTVDLGAQTIQAGSFVKAGGTSAQFLKADGSVDSNAYGTGTVTSVGLTMPSAFNVANSPVTTAGTLAVTGAGNASQYIAGDGTLVSFPSLTGYVPYTGANQTVNLNTQQLQAGHTTLTTNGSTETLTINHTSGSGKAINVTKGGAGEGLYVNKTSGSGNAATIVGTLEATTLVKTGGTSSQFLKADGSVDSTSYQPLLTNPVTGTGTTNYLPKFTGASTIGNSNIQDSGSLVSVGVTSTFASNINVTNNVLINLGTASTASTGGTLWLTTNNNTSRAAAIQAITQTTDNAHDLLFYTNSTFDTPKERLRIFSDGNVFIGPTASNNGARLQVSGTATFSNTVTANDNIIMLGGEFYYGNNSSNQFARNFVTGTSGSATLNYSFWNGSSWQTVSTLNSTGAATFSSSVTASGMTLLNSGGTYLNYYVSTFLIGRIGNVDTNDMYYDSTFGGNHYFRTGTGGTTSPTTKFTIASSGAISNDFSASGTFAASFTNSNSTGYGLYVRGGSNVREAILIADNAGNQNIRLYGDGSATFSSSVTVSSNDGIVVGAGGRAFIKQTVGGDAEIGAPLNGTLSLISNGASVLSFAGTGVATFSSDVTTGTGFQGRYTRIFEASGQRGGFYPYNVISGGGADYSIGLFSESELFFLSGGGVTKRMVIANSGNVLIGATTDNGKPLQILGVGGLGVYSSNSYGSTISVDFNGGQNIGHLLADQNAYYIRTLTAYPIYVMPNQANGVYLSVGSTSWTANSDERLKNINGIIENAVEKLLTLRAINFSWKSDNSNKEVLGLIAQDVEKLLPQVIDKNKLPNSSNDETEYLGIRYVELIPVLVKAIQELQAKLDKNNIN